jgi:hypothetical protein
MLGDRDVVAQQRGVRRPAKIGRVVDIERIDADERGPPSTSASAAASVR